MKNIIIVLFAFLISILSCNKEKQHSDKVASITSYKTAKVDEYLDSLVRVNKNYSGLIHEIRTFTEEIMNSDLTFAEYKSFILAGQIDSIYGKMNFPIALQNHYDTIFSYYAFRIYNDFQLDTISNNNCRSCQFTTEQKIDLTEGYWDYFKGDSTRIASYYGHLLDNIVVGGCPNPWGYAICVAACVATFGEIPPLCIICIWQCACQFCPSPNIGCNWQTN